MIGGRNALWLGNGKVVNYGYCQQISDLLAVLIQALSADRRHGGGGYEINKINDLDAWVSICWVHKQ